MKNMTMKIADFGLARDKQTKDNFGKQNSICD